MKEEFANYASHRHRNYGVRVTSGTEGSHSSLKRLLRNRTGDIYALGSAIKQMCQRQERVYDLKKDKETRKRLSSCHGNPIYNLLHSKVSFFTLQQVVEQTENARKVNQDPRGGLNWNCTGKYTSQYGIPCWQRLHAIVQQNGMIDLRLLDMHWRFDKGPLPADEEALRRIMDPALIPRRQLVGRRHDQSV